MHAISKVAIVTAETYDIEVVEQAVDQALAYLGGITSFIKPGDRVLLKPNMLEGLPPDKAVTTHPEVVRAVIRQVRNAGATVMVGDSPAFGGTYRVAEQCGILAVCREEGAALVAFDQPMELYLPQGVTVKRLTVAAAFGQADKVISIAKMKTHSFMGVTGAVKNLFGFFVGADKAQFHLRMRKRADFANMLVDLYGGIKPVLSLVDGIVGMEGAGPRNGARFASQVVLAGACGFSVDLAMAAMMGFDAEKMPVAQAAIATNASPLLGDIERLGNACAKRYQFQQPRRLDTLDDKLPAWLVELGQTQLTIKPQIEPHCIGCGRCAAHCPPQAIAIIDGRAVIDLRACIRCYCCQELCPANAVRLVEGKLLKALRKLPKISLKQ